MSFAEVVSSLIALLALVVAVASYALSQKRVVSEVRSELLGYVTKIVALDRAGGRQNGHQINALCQQSGAVIDQYGKKLNLAPVVYRLLGEHVALDTDELALAERIVKTGLAGARQQNNLLEEVRCVRALAEIAGLQLNLHQMDILFAQAVALAEQPDSSSQPAIWRSRQRTRAFALMSALLAAENGAGEEAMGLANQYLDRALKDGLDDLYRRGALEIARRADRVKQPHDDMEGLDLQAWRHKWHERDRMTAN